MTQTINNEQRKRFAKLIEDNGTYSDFYKTKYEAKDKATLKKNASTIESHSRLVIAKTKLEDSQESNRSKLIRVHNEKIQKLNDAHNKILEGLEKSDTKAVHAIAVKTSPIHQKLIDLGLEYTSPSSSKCYNCRNYADRDDRTCEYSDSIVCADRKIEGGIWRTNNHAYRLEYEKWQKQLIADIWASDTVAKARALVRSFLGKTVNVE